MALLPPRQLLQSEELGAALSSYCRRGEGASSRCRDVPLQPQKWRPPRTHLHAELVRKRKDPNKSPKVEVEAALLALQAGDQAAVEALMRREGEDPVAEEWQQRYRQGARAYWDQFYREKTLNFFKDRHYLREEFSELMPQDVLADPKRWIDTLEVSSEGPPTSKEEVLKAMQGRTVLLELGCAVGNGLIPMLRANSELFGLACDLSVEAVRLLQSKEEYSCGRCLAFPCDITKAAPQQPSDEHRGLEDEVPEGSVDFATLLFVLSAIDPTQYVSTLARIRSRMRPGGVILVRDYGRGDLAQLRFGAGHWLGGDTYVRGDGTLAVFLTDTGLAADFEAAGFETLSCEYRRTEVVNRGTGVVMPRVWVQGRFRNPESGAR